MIDAGPRVVLIAHGYLSGVGVQPVPSPAGQKGGEAQQAESSISTSGAVSLLSTFAGLRTIFAQREDLRRIAPVGFLLTWHSLALSVDPAPRLFTLHLPHGRSASPPVREGRAQRATWDRVARTLPPLPGAPDEPPVHFALLSVLDSVLHARVSAGIPLMPDGRIDPRLMILPPDRWPAGLPTTRLRVVPRPSPHRGVRHRMVDPFRAGWALLTSGPVPQAVVAALQDATVGVRWTVGANGQPAHTLRRRQSLVRTTITLPGPDGYHASASPNLMAYLPAGTSFDMVVDVLLVLLIHAQEAGAEAPPIWATAEGLLDARGLRRVRKRDGKQVRDAGHRVEDIAAVSAAMRLLATLRVEAALTTGSGATSCRPASLLIVHEAQERERTDGPTQQVAWRYSPGPWVGALSGGREPAALFPRCALQYDPYRQRYAKRLARYLAFHFRMDAGHGGPLSRAIGTLLQDCALTPDRRNPERTRQALEGALDRLQADGLLASWQLDDAVLPARGWLPVWLRRRLVLTPAAQLQERYAHLRGRR